VNQGSRKSLYVQSEPGFDRWIQPLTDLAHWNFLLADWVGHLFQVEPSWGWRVAQSEAAQAIFLSEDLVKLLIWLLSERLAVRDAEARRLHRQGCVKEILKIGFCAQKESPVLEFVASPSDHLIRHVTTLLGG
jgi:hypothetical protein